MTKNRRPRSKNVYRKSRKILTEVRPHIVRRLALCTGPFDVVVAFCMREDGLGTELDSLETFPRSSADSISCIAELLLLWFRRFPPLSRSSCWVTEVLFKFDDNKCLSLEASPTSRDLEPKSEPSKSCTFQLVSTNLKSIIIQHLSNS